jgi:indolepyruvate ferredoxin oxidoreductase
MCVGNPFSIDDRYRAEQGQCLLTGTQALVLLTVLQRRRDAARGLRTGGFVSGYRGSPLGTVDVEFERARAVLAPLNIRCQPGVNEALSATACWGTQYLHLDKEARVDGVFALWYGKGAGLDQSVDAMRHANNAGTAPRGGVLAVVGDDHTLKSSAQAHHCEPTFADLGIPVLYPASVQELLELGLLGIALSRVSGCWVGLKTVAEVVNTTAVVALEPDLGQAVELDPQWGAGDVHLRWPDPWPAGEQRFHKFKLPRVLEFARRNRLDRVTFAAPATRLGIVTTGKSWLDVLEALRLLDLSEHDCRALGVSIYKVAMPWPLEPFGVTDFCRGAGRILVVEEKRGIIEAQLRQHLYDEEDGGRPVIEGRRDQSGAELFSPIGELSPTGIAEAIAARLPASGATVPAEAPWRTLRLRTITPLAQAALRTPFFCAGCPHNTSTVVPEGSRAMAGIGCHGMAMFSPGRRTATHTHMGGEGATWIGEAPFTAQPHVFQNLGDGTYFHSASLAIRAAVAAGVNVTYKILFNDAVAMTGGQAVDGELTVGAITRQLRAEGVREICVVADDPDRYRHVQDLAPGVRVHPREALDAVQRRLREIPGVTALVYDQVCATERRRRVKRGLASARDTRVFINDLVCEGCGDCNVKSNCLAVVPIDTEFGRKRAVDQSACNQDLSCLRGFCPSFVTVTGARLRDPSKAVAEKLAAFALPEPPAAVTGEPCNIVLTGVGGTGVVTVAAILGAAAHLEGRACSIHDRLGMAQKFGPVTSHVRIGQRTLAGCAARIPDGSADLILSGDPLTTARDEVLATLARGRTRIVFNSDCSNAGAFATAPDLDFGVAGIREHLAGLLGDPARIESLPAAELALAACGDSIGANMLMLGYAMQRGLVPLRIESVLRAIELNGTAVEKTRLALLTGRIAAADMGALRAALAPHLPWHRREAASEGLVDLVTRRRDYLVEYHDEAYARSYMDLVDAVRRAEAAAVPGETRLTQTVARNYFKLLAVKDEYEVARLHASAAFAAKLASQFEGDYRLHFHLAPPLLSRADPATGLPRKRRFGAWILPLFRLLARARRLRGTTFDPFRFSSDRRLDRRLLGDYEAAVALALARLDRGNHAIALELLALPEQIRGYGPIRRHHALEADAARQALMEKLRAPLRDPEAARARAGAASA